MFKEKTKIKVRIAKPANEARKFSLRGLGMPLLVGLVAAGLFSSVFSAFAFFSPGATSDPGCTAGTSGCSVTPPLYAITGGELDNVFSSDGLLKRTGPATYTVDTSTYLTGNQTISLSGDLSGSGATSISGTVTGLQGKPLPSLVTGLLKYNGSAWVFDTTPYLTAVTGASLDNVFTANGLLERTGSGSYQSATPGTDYVVPSATTLSSLTNIGSSLSGLLKASSGSLSAAVSGVDFAPPTSGSSILEGNGSGGFANATAGTDYVVPGVTSLSSLAAVGSLTSGSIGSGFSVGGVTMSLGSDAAGDTYYRNGSGILTRLGIGSTGNVLEVAGGVPSWQPAPAAAPGGSDTQVQYNNGGALAGDADLTWDNASKVLSLNGTAALDIQGSNGATHYDNIFQGSASQTGSATYTLPVNYPASSGYLLSADTSGVMSWVSPTAGVWSYVNTTNLMSSTAGNGSITGNGNFLAILNAGNGITSGSNNVFIGGSAGLATTTGLDNTFLGGNAGISNTGGGYNNFLGYGSGTSNTTGAANNFLGYRAGNSSTTAANDNFLGQQSGFNNTTGSTNNFLGSAAGYSNTTGANNNFFGLNTGFYNTTGNDNNFLGYRIETVTTATGSENNFLGYQTGYSNTSGSNNNFFGRNAGAGNITGSGNNFLGASAGSNNTSGTDNNFIGSSAGSGNTTGSANNFLGNTGVSNTTGSNNNFFGFNAGGSNTAGSNNNMIGLNAGADNVTGGSDDYFGISAGYHNNGNNNVFIGPYAGNRQTATSNTLFIDNQDRLSSANEQTQSLLYGTFGTPNSNISSNTQSLTINAGQVALPYMPTGGGLVDVQIDPTTGILYQATSSEAFKTNIQPLTDNWDALLDAQPKSYTYKNLGNASIGFLAQDFDSLGLKDLVNYVNGQPYAIDYNLIPVYLVEIAKQQQTDIDSLKLLAGLSQTGSTGNGSVFGVNSDNVNALTNAGEQLLALAGVTFQNGVTFMKDLSATTLTAKTAVVTQGIDITDQATGEVYCTWLANGQWQKAEGDCAAVFANLPPMTDTVSSSGSSPETAITPATQDQIQQTNQNVEQVTQQVQRVTQQVQQVTQSQTQPSAQAQAAAAAAQQAANEAQQAAQQAQQQNQVTKTALESAITQAQSETQSDYTSDSWGALQTALAAAQAADQNSAAQQSAVDAAAANLTAAIGALVPDAQPDSSSDSTAAPPSSMVETTSGISQLIQSGASNLASGFVQVFNYFLEGTALQFQSLGFGAPALASQSAASGTPSVYAALVDPFGQVFSSLASFAFHK